MKIKLLNVLFLLSSIAYSQQKAYLEFEDDNSTANFYNQENSTNESKTLAEAENEFGTINENISFGLSLGFNNSMEDLKLAQVSPVDKTVLITDAQKTSFVLSTVISIPLTFNDGKTYRYLDNNGNQMGQVHKISEWSLIGVVNIATFQGAQSGNVFNQKLSGGLGLSYNFSEDFGIGICYEMLSYRKPKDFLLDMEGQELQVGGTAVTTIDTNDNDYYYDRYAGTLAFKVIYKLTK